MAYDEPRTGGRRHPGNEGSRWRARLFSPASAGPWRRRAEPRELACFAGYLHDPGIGVLVEAKAACGCARVHAMHDPTEGGLATGLWEMALASGIGLRVDASAIPVLDATRRLCGVLGLDPLGLIASGSLALAVAPRDASRVIAAPGVGVPCTQTGWRFRRATVCSGDSHGRDPAPRYDQTITRALSTVSRGGLR